MRKYFELGYSFGKVDFFYVKVIEFVVVSGLFVFVGVECFLIVLGCLLFWLVFGSW